VPNRPAYHRQDELKIDVSLTNCVVDAAERARALEATGVDGVFSVENKHDVFFPLVAAAPVCSLDMLTNVAMAFPRSPLHLAHASDDLQLLSQGRVRLGLGTQVRAHIENRFGSRWDKPVRQMREWVLATRAILECWQHGTRLDFRGEYTKHTLMTPAFSPEPNPYGIPKILVGALGPKINEMAAEVADGVLVMPFNSERHMRERTLPAIERGLATSGRTRADYEVNASLIVGVGRNDEELATARAVKSVIAFYSSTPAYRPVLEVEGWEALQPELNAMTKSGRWNEMPDLISDEMMHTIAVYGTPKEVAAQIVERFGDCDRVSAYFSGYQPSDDLIADFAAAVKQAS
jgi:probable F420-dependent oxidoreductase